MDAAPDGGAGFAGAGAARFSMSAVPREKREKPPVDWDLVLKRNPVERLKREKAPLGIREELPALIAQGYENVAEEDVVRLQWWGLYHDKPKIGTFMLRIKVPAGQLPPSHLRAIGEVSNLYGKGDGELSTRQNIQLHWLELAKLPDVFAHLERAGITTAGGCGDTVRNITGCPVQGIAADELFDASPIVTSAADLFYGNPDWANLPRKHKYSISACADRCNAPEINCISLIGTVKQNGNGADDRREGFAVLVGGGLSSVPRIARDMGVFVPAEEANEILGAITSVWSEDLKYRVSRVKARLKFMVDDIGPEGIRVRVEAKLGRELEDYSLPPVEVEPSHHLGVHAQKQEGLSYVGVPVHLGLISGDQMIAIAGLADRYGGDIRLTRQQNFIVTGIPNDTVAEAQAEIEKIGFPLDVNPVRGNSIACTGEPHCNFSVAETKTRLGALIVQLEERFGTEVADLRLHLDGCPHACAQHWVGDLGFQGTTARDEGGVRRQAYDIFVRGGLGPSPAVGRSLFRRVPTDELDAAVHGLIAGWIERREPGESFPAFTRRVSDEELGELAGLEPAKVRQREEEEAA
jgi:sulfite reductase beta subunit-like hemoprotein